MAKQKTIEDAKDGEIVVLPNKAEYVGPNPMAMLAKMVNDGVDPDKLGRMMDLAERWQAGEAAKAYALAVSGFQAKCPMVFKGREVLKNDGKKLYNFANYEDIRKATRDLAREFGITTSYTIEQTDNGLMKGTIRVRVGNHFEDKTLTVPVPKGINTNATQDYGMAVSYLKRYLYCAALDIVVSGEDDDARGLVEKITQDQIQNINDAIDRCFVAGNPVDLGKFKAWLATKASNPIEDLSDVPVKLYTDAMGFLQRKEKEKKVPQ